MTSNVNRLVSLTKVTEALDTAHAALDLQGLSDLTAEELDSLSDIVTSINFCYNVFMNKQLLILSQVKSDVEETNRIDAAFNREPKSGAV